MVKTGRNSVQQMLRLPDGMRDKLKEMAAFSGRSMNAEIVDRLDKSLRRWFYLDVPEHLLDQAIKLPAGVLEDVIDDISEIAVRKIEVALNRHDLSRMNLLHDFAKLLEDRPDEERKRLQGELDRLLQKAGLQRDDR